MARRPSSKKLDKSVLSAASRVCACFNLRKASRAVTQEFNAVLQPCGLRSTQFVLMVVAHSEEPVSMARLANALVMDRSTLVRNLKPLEKEGLLTHGPGRGRTSSLIRLTPKGRRTLKTALPLWERAQSAFVQRVGARRWESLLPLLAAASRSDA